MPLAFRNCAGVSRRNCLKLGLSAALGSGLTDLLRWRAAASESAGIPARARSCILIWQDGGPTHYETFDPKPEAPSEVAVLVAERVRERAREDVGVATDRHLVIAMTTLHAHVAIDALDVGEDARPMLAHRRLKHRSGDRIGQLVARRAGAVIVATVRGDRARASRSWRAAFV